MPLDGTEYTPDDPVITIIDKVGRLIYTEDNWGQGTVGRNGVPIEKGHNLDSREQRYCPITAVANLRRCGSAEIFSAVTALDYFGKAATELSGRPITTARYNNAPGRKFSEIQTLIARARKLRLADVLEKV